MSLLSFLLGERKNTAGCREGAPADHPRARTRRLGRSVNYLPALQKELIAVISKYVKVRPEDIRIQLERKDNLEVLKVKIELPDPARP
jgi:cell division topological specificity factor